MPQAIERSHNGNLIFLHGNVAFHTAACVLQAKNCFDVLSRLVTSSDLQLVENVRVYFECKIETKQEITST